MIKVHTFPPYISDSEPDVAFIEPMYIMAVYVHQMELTIGVRYCTKILMRGSAEPLFVAETPEEISVIMAANEATMSGVDRPMAYPGSLKDPEDPVVLSKETHKNGTEVSRTADGRTGVFFRGVELIFTDDLQESLDGDVLYTVKRNEILERVLEGDFEVNEVPEPGEPFDECTDDSDNQPWGEMTQEEVNEEAAWEAASDECSEGEDDEEDWDELYDELDDLDFPESHDPTTPTTDAT